MDVVTNQITLLATVYSHKLYTVVPQHTAVAIYKHFELRSALAAKFCFDLRLEIPVTNTKKAGGKGSKFKFLTVGGEEAASL